MRSPRSSQQASNAAHYADRWIGVVGIRLRQLVPPLIIGTSVLLAGCGGQDRRSGAAVNPVDPPASASAASAGAPYFVDRTLASGIKFRLAHHNKTPLTVLDTMGTGCAIADFDGDGHADLFFVGQTGTESQGRCALYRGKGDGTFEDVTAGSGLDAPGMYMGCTVADLNNDGLPDLIVTGYGVMRVYRNLGHFKFRDVTEGSGMEAHGAHEWATSAACGDYDRDGLVDVYVGRYLQFDDKALQYCNYGGVKASCGPNFYDAQVGSMYRNLGNFHFKDVTREVGLTSAHGKCLGALFCDIDGDGWPDLYLANDEIPGDLFLNRKGRHFDNVGREYGVALASDATFQGGMGIDAADFNRDGYADLFVTTFEAEPDSLYASGSAGAFTHDSVRAGLAQATKNLVGFGTKFADFDNDGWLDLVIANGHIHDNEEQVDNMGHYRQQGQLFLQRNHAFVDASAQAGPGLTDPMVGRGLAVGDLDNDGRMDVVIMDLEGRPRVLMNRMENTGSWLTVKLRGTRSNSLGIGARVTVRAGDQKWIAQAGTGGSYLSASDPRVHFGLGAVSHVDTIEVVWPSGRRSEMKSPPVSKEIEIREP